MKNWKDYLSTASIKALPIERLTRTVLFPLSVVFAVSALFIAVSTYSDLERSSVSTAFSTVQSVQEAFAQESEYPDEIVYPSTERQIAGYWLVSTSGDLLVSSNSDSTLDAGLWEMTSNAAGGSFLADYELNGDPVSIAGTISPGEQYWTLVAISPAYSFTTVIWLIFSVLALSLMSVTGVIAVRFLGFSFVKAPDTSEDVNNIDVEITNFGGDGAVVESDGLPIPSISKLHEAVMQVTEDFVLVLDSERNVVYSSLIGIEGPPEGEGFDGIQGFADHHLDDSGRKRFEKWIAKGPSSKPLTMDVFDDDGFSIPTRWEARSVEMKSGTTFDVFVGRRLEVESFPLSSV